MVEALAAFALVGLAVAGIASVMSYSGNAQRNVDQVSQFYNLMNDIKTILGSQDNCTQNFLGVNPADPTIPDFTSTTPPKPFPLQQYNFSSGAAVATGTTFGQTNSKYQSLTVTSAGIKRKRQIAANLYLMSYEITAARDMSATATSSSATRELNSSIPFSILVNPVDGSFSRCFTDPFSAGSTAVEQFLCAISSSYQQVYDPNTQACVSKYQDFTVTTPNSYTSGACPAANTNFSGCSVENTNTSGSVTQPTSRHYGTWGSSAPIGMPGALANKTSSNTCECIYSTSYSPLPSTSTPPAPGDPVCTTHCNILRTDLVNTWPYTTTPL
jgi:hypothetical protein